MGLNQAHRLGDAGGALLRRAGEAGGLQRGFALRAAVNLAGTADAAELPERAVIGGDLVD